VQFFTYISWCRGSGGSIFLAGANTSGSCPMLANGGNATGGRGGGGGGGRITISYGNNSTLTGIISAIGGAGGTRATAGGPGTVYSYKFNDLSTASLTVGSGGYSIGATRAISSPKTTSGGVAWLCETLTVLSYGSVLLYGDAGLAINGNIPAYLSQYTLFSI
jgi:hypothetical protein